jgi:uncharacterized protein (TIGR02246 family)/steroid delta-isomerase-like uncharacterized protein
VIRTGSSGVLDAGVRELDPPARAGARDEEDFMSDETDIKAVFDGFLAAWNQGDAQGTSGKYVEDGVLIDPWGNQAQGRQNIEKMFAGLFETVMRGSRSSFEIHKIRQVKPDVAFVDATQKVKLGAGAPMPELTVHLALLATKKDGKWMFADGRPYAFLQMPGRLKAIVDRAWEHFERGQVDQMVELMAEDVEFKMPGAALRGPKEIRPFLAAWRVAFPDLRHEFIDSVESGDTIGIELHVRGTHTGTLQSPRGEIPATGKALVWESFDYIKLRDGKIASWHVYFDQVPFLEQLGLMPSK